MPIRPQICGGVSKSLPLKAAPPSLGFMQLVDQRAHSNVSLFLVRADLVFALEVATHAWTIIRSTPTQDPYNCNLL
jgi:hypothetical protein